MNIIVDYNTPISNGTEVVFRSPVDCSQITGLIVCYPDNGSTASRAFAFADAHGNNVGDIDHLFAENVVVKVILDLSTNMAFVQNADTNAYLEGRFAELEAMSRVIPVEGQRFDDFLDASGDGETLVPGNCYLLTSDAVGAGLVKGDIVLARDPGYSWQGNIMGGGSSTEIIALSGVEIEALGSSGSLVPGAYYFLNDDYDSYYTPAGAVGILYRATEKDAPLEEVIRLATPYRSLNIGSGLDLYTLAGMHLFIKGAYYLATTDYEGQGYPYLETTAGTLYKATDRETLEPVMNLGGGSSITDADKEEIAQYVLEKLPIYGGETEEVVANE